jgi:hypothetical protein
MFNENLNQRVRVCKGLLSLMDQGHLWASDGPTAEAKKLLDQYGGPMSNPQWILYQVVWYVWGRPADVKLQEVMQLPAPYSEIVTTLLTATLKGPASVETWLGRLEESFKSPKSRPAKLIRLA